MALIKCKECGKEFSDTSESCPNCGYKNKHKSKIVAGILCLFLYWLGAHELYLGNVKKAVLWIIAYITFFILWILSAFFLSSYLIIILMACFASLVPIICAIKLFIIPQGKFDSKYNSSDSPKIQIKWVVLVYFGMLCVLGALIELVFPYFRTFEKAHVSEVIPLMNEIFDAQQIYYSKMGNYASSLYELDINIKDINAEKISPYYFETSNFIINSQGYDTDAYVEATKRNDSFFFYKIRKYYKNGKVECIDKSTDSICPFLGITDK
ncbi:MAG: TM2 domain-containing protein [Elusimicrobiaceae bacterium]|nr:TM2 domain-containing protein [Elusimicrobiaceae bacterium]